MIAGRSTVINYWPELSLIIKMLNVIPKAIFFFFCLTAFLAGNLCQAGSFQPAGPDKELSIVTGIAPQAYLARRLAGEKANIIILTPPGASPHTFEPTPKQLAQLHNADIFAYGSLPFELRLAHKLQASAPQSLKLVDLNQGISLRDFTSQEESFELQAHGHNVSQAAGSHHHSTDPHVWLSLRLAAKQAQSLAGILAQIDPAHKETYEGNLAALQDQLQSLDQKLTRLLAPIKGQAFFAYHPAFGYLGDDYGLRQVAVELGGKEPGPKRMVLLIEQAKELGVKVIFVQPQLNPAGAESIARAINAVVVPMDPLVYDYLDNLEQMARQLSQGLSQ